MKFIFKGIGTTSAFVSSESNPLSGAGRFPGSGRRPDLSTDFENMILGEGDPDTPRDFFDRHPTCKARSTILSLVEEAQSN